MPRTHPYAPMHAINHHPLAPWLERYQINPQEARIEAMRNHEKHEEESTALNEFEAVAAFHAGQVARRGELKPSDGPRFIKETASLVEALATWSENGRKIYEFGAELTHELLKTEIQNVTTGDFKPPMSCFYLTFDMDAPYALPGGQLLDGVMVSFVEFNDSRPELRMMSGCAKQRVSEISFVFMARGFVA